MPQETKSIEPLEQRETLQHHTVGADDPVALRKAVELAVDYRGDVTITRISDDTPVECFIFDFKADDDPARAKVRALPKNEDSRIAIALNDIRQLAFTGKDTAAGRSFDTWMKKYVAKKLAGETASIESESLD